MANYRALFWDQFNYIYCIRNTNNDANYMSLKTEFENLGISDKINYYNASNSVNEMFHLQSVCEIAKDIQNIKHEGYYEPIIVFQDFAMFDLSRLYNLKRLVPFIDNRDDDWDTIQLGSFNTIYQKELLKDTIYLGKAYITPFAIILSPKVVHYIANTEFNKLSYETLYQTFDKHIILRNNLCVHRQYFNLQYEQEWVLYVSWRVFSRLVPKRYNLIKAKIFEAFMKRVYENNHPSTFMTLSL